MLPIVLLPSSFADSDVTHSDSENAGRLLVCFVAPADVGTIHNAKKLMLSTH